MAATSSSSATPDDMHIYEFRLASFSKIHPRRRNSNAAGKAAQPPFKWPHTSPSVEKLAKAGFFYRPTASSIDNASCYLCKKSLDGWEPDDVPAIEHAKHSYGCGWAVIHATEVRLRSNSKAVIDDPRGEAMAEARRMTFGSRWPHEKKKGWVPKVDKLVEAGFHYAPTAESDDFVQCGYCELGLDGWDPQDDPFEEHRRRQEDCVFFTWKKARSGRASSVGPATTTITTTTAREAAREASVADSHPPDSELSAAESTISTTKGTKKGGGTRGRKPAATTTTNRRKPARGRDATAAAESELDSAAGSPPPPRPTGRAPRGKKRTSSALGANRVSLFDANDFVEEQFAKPALPAKPVRQSKRARASLASNAVAAGDEDQQQTYDSDASVATTATTSKRKRPLSAATRGKAPLARYQIPDDEEIDRALELDLERELTEEEDTTRYTKPFIKTPKRRLTRNKLATSQMMMEGPPPALGSLALAGGASAKLGSAKKFTPAGMGMRNYFANQELDYSLPISIPRHLAGGDVEDRMEEDTPVKEREREREREKPPPGRKGGKAAEPEPEPEPMEMEEDDLVIVSEKITKKGGGGRKTKKTTTTTTRKSLEKIQKASTAAPPPAPPAEEAGGEGGVEKLRNLRKSVDGGMVLFDGGATSESETEPMERVEEGVEEGVEDSIVVAAPEPEVEMVPERKVVGGKKEKEKEKEKGGKSTTTTATTARGKRAGGGKRRSDPTPTPTPDPEAEPEAEQEQEQELTPEPMDVVVVGRGDAEPEAEEAEVEHEHIPVPIPIPEAVMQEAPPAPLRGSKRGSGSGTKKAPPPPQQRRR